MANRDHKIIEFLKIIEKCKTIERRIYCSQVRRRESDAEHSWHLAMFLILFSQTFAAKYDIFKAVKIALIHDLAEIYAGDVFTFDLEGQKKQKPKEEKAAGKLFAKLPPDLAQEFSQLFREYQNSSSPEAKLVKALDKIQPIMQNIVSDGKSWKEHHITLEQVDNLKKQYGEFDKDTLKIYNYILEEAKKKFLK